MKNAKVYEFGAGNLGGGLSVYAKNLSGSDWPTVVTLSGVSTLTDGLRITLEMNSRFNNANCISQVKAYLRRINPNITFSDEPELLTQSFDDDNLYSPEQVSSVAHLNKSSFNSEHLAVFQWACKKGYIYSQSYTQFNITPKFIEWHKAGQAA